MVITRTRVWSGVVCAILAIAPAACKKKRDACSSGQTRCNGEVAQICDPKGRWQTLADCKQVSERNHKPFMCAPITVPDQGSGVSGHTCVPAAAAIDGGAP